MSEHTNRDIENIAKKIISAKHFVIFTGAGISTASGLSDYRGPDGVWTRRDKGLKPIPPKVPWDRIQPNSSHYAITEFQKLGLLKALISQNVDGLHIDSGLNHELIAELHGNKNILKCLSCDSRFFKTEVGWEDETHGKGYRSSKPMPNQPKCNECDGRLISSIVNFGDPMPKKETDFSHHHSREADLFLVLGSSLVVNPAAGYPRIAKMNGADLIIINKGDTPLDSISDLKLDVDLSEIMPKLLNEVKERLP